MLTKIERHTELKSRGGCEAPPLSPAEKSADITVLDLTDYSFQSSVTYACPYGKVFSGTLSRYQAFTCFGPVGWNRPETLSCENDMFIPSSSGPGNSWDAVKKCYANGRAGLVEIVNITGRNIFRSLANYNSDHLYMTSGSRLRDMQMGINNDSAFWDSTGIQLVPLNPSALWKSGEPSNNMGIQYSVNFKDGKLEDGQYNKTDIYAGCQKSTPTSCRRPPLGTQHMAMNITVNLTSDTEMYPYGSIAAYKCPPGKLFPNGQNVLLATCYGSAGWDRDLYMSCSVAPDVFEPDHQFFGSVWEAAELCFSQGAGLPIVRNSSSFCDFWYAVNPAKNSTYYSGHSRVQDVQSGQVDKTVYRNPIDNTELSSSLFSWGSDDPSDSTNEELILAFSSDKMIDMFTDCNKSPTRNFFCRTACQKSSPTTCRAPPITQANINEGMTCVVSGSQQCNATTTQAFAFHTVASYTCPKGTVFDGTSSRFLNATCYGNVGWKRPMSLACVPPATVTIGSNEYFLIQVDKSKTSSEKRNTYWAEAYCHSEGGTLPLVNSSSDLTTLGTYLSSQGATSVHLGNNISKQVSDAGGDLKVAWDTAYPGVQGLWLPGEPASNLSNLCSLLAVDSSSDVNTFKLKSVNCKSGFSSVPCTGALVCGLSNDTGCSQPPPLRTEVSSMSDGSDANTGSWFPFLTNATYNACECGEVRGRIDNSSASPVIVDTDVTSTCFGQFGWYKRNYTIDRRIIYINTKLNIIIRININTIYNHRSSNRTWFVPKNLSL
ncbi:unnamed protein product [Notodromas monacha]|uniref:Sushi domain-containing protein n=1 Tax=Notodromas monacha TaxID=399045 RepID=A0A7R9GI79_9CRUS|nr:unnamed protein product [Notodromas monacha]CAG0922308.1 unnamed protein product [Notodromas monacha]